MPLSDLSQYMLKSNIQSAFIRPSHDTKSFVAKLYNIEEMTDWCQTLSKINPDEYSQVYLSTQAMVCSEKTIEREYRFFIVDGKVITGSLYKRNGKYKTEECTEKYLYDYVNNAINIATIADAFVLDVAISEGNPYILEINNINSSGLYDIDSMKWIIAMEELGNKIKNFKP